MGHHQCSQTDEVKELVCNFFQLHFYVLILYLDSVYQISLYCIFVYLIYFVLFLLKSYYGASLVVQWLRIRLPMQGTRVRALVWEDPTCRGATGPVSHNY